MPAGTAVTRRGAMALALGSPLALAACDIDPPARTDAEGTAAPADPDAALLAEVVDAVRSVAARLAATLEGGPDTLDAVAAFTALHAAHLSVLDPHTTPTSPGNTAPGEPFARLPGLLAAERSLQVAVADAAARAASGTLARAFASASAGVAAQLAAAAGGAR